MAHRGCLGGGCCFSEGVFVIVVGELLISGCCVMAVSGAVVGVLVILGNFGYGGRVVVLVLMMIKVMLAVVTRKNSFIHMIHAFACGGGSGGGVNSGCGSSCLANHHLHHHHTVYTRLYHSENYYNCHP